MEARFTRKSIARGGRTHMEVEITPPDEPRDKRPVCMVLAIDMSDGMGEPERTYGFTKMYTPIISPVRRAAYTVIEELGDEDMFGCAVFNHEAFLCQEPMHPVSEQVPDIKIQISRIEPHGDRNLAAGLWMAGSLFNDRIISLYKCKIVLIACGDTFPSCIGEERLPEMCGALRKMGIEVSVIGVGTTYTLESFMEMADSGGGRAYHVKNFEHLPEILRFEAEALRNRSAMEASLVVRSDSFIETGANLNGFRQSNKRGRAEIFLGNLREGVSVYFEMAASGTKKKAAEIELELTWREAGRKTRKLLVFSDIGVSQSGEKCASTPYGRDVLSRYLGAFAEKSLLEALISCDKFSMDQMERDFALAKDAASSLAALYPACGDLIGKFTGVMDEKGKIFLDGRLESGINKALAMELCEMLRKNGKKTIKSLYI